MAATESTYEALLKRSIGTLVARKIVESGLTISELKLKPKSDLIDLGLNEKQATSLLDESRPPIPDEIFYKVLHESKSVCCVCRNPNRGFIIHHLKEWSESHSHEFDNLVVLCLLHHDQAHTKKEISIEFSPERIKKLRDAWYKVVKAEDAKVIISKASTTEANWTYFNHKRLYELLDSNIEPSTFKGFSILKSSNLLMNDGKMQNLSALAGEKSLHMYHTGEGHILYQYHKKLFEAVLEKLPIIIISNKTTLQVKAIVNEGSYIAFDGTQYFKNTTKLKAGLGQSRNCRSRGNIVVSFSFDAWESTSMSAWADHLTGTKKALIIGQVRTIETKEDKLILHCSVLAIGFWFGSISSSIGSSKEHYTSFDFLKDLETD